MDDEEEAPEHNMKSILYLKRTFCLKLVRFRCPNTTTLYHYPSLAVSSAELSLEKFLSDFKWAGQRLAHVFADDWSKASHNLS